MGHIEAQKPTEAPAELTNGPNHPGGTAAELQPECTHSKWAPVGGGAMYRCTTCGVMR